MRRRWRLADAMVSSTDMVPLYPPVEGEKTLLRKRLLLCYWAQELAAGVFGRFCNRVPAHHLEQRFFVRCSWGKRTENPTNLQTLVGYEQFGCLLSLSRFQLRKRRIFLPCLGATVRSGLCPCHTDYSAVVPDRGVPMPVEVSCLPWVSSLVCMSLPVEKTPHWIALC